ncbi:MAG: hypothetical protein ACREMB_08780, partial [Candidatus Rokuibacteriota bacterium]
MDISANLLHAVCQSRIRQQWMFQDEYRAALIQAKAGGQTLALPAAPAAPATVVDLMEALRQSVEQVRKPGAKADGAAERAQEAA